jgi:hypothetical protein
LADLESGRASSLACDGKLQQRETPAIDSSHKADDYDLDLGNLGAGVGGMRFPWTSGIHGSIARGIGYCT